MVEIGKVCEIKNNLAKVEIIPLQSCRECPMEKLCLKVDEKRYIEAINKINVQIGDKVKLYLPNKKFISNSFLIFLFPLIMLVIGAWLGDSIFNSQTLSIILGVSFLLITFFILRFVDKKLAKRKFFFPEIIEILK